VHHEVIYAPPDLPAGVPVKKYPQKEGGVVLCEQRSGLDFRESGDCRLQVQPGRASPETILSFEGD